jgi:hypothetical protein
MAGILSRPKIEETWDSPEVAQAAIEALEQTP